MQTLNHIINAINTPSDACEKGMAERLNGLVKPIGSLGRLESLAIQLSGISHTLAPAYPRKQIIVTAADHGVYDEDVSSAPQVVTRMQMVNMVEEKAGVNVLAKQAGAEVLLVDTGIKGDTIDRVLDFRVRQGSDNIAMGPAMRRDEAYCLIERCANLAIAQVEKGVSLIGVGELGMANTTPAAAMVSVMCHAAPELTVGVGANFPERRLQHKVEVVNRAIAVNRPDAQDGVDVLAKVGGFDLCGMTGVIIGAAAAGVPVVLDGFLSYAAALAAVKITPRVYPYLVPSHSSAEKGTLIALAALKLHPVLNMGMRLGEGSGAALMFPIIDAACEIPANMGTLASGDIALSK